MHVFPLIDPLFDSVLFLDPPLLLFLLDDLRFDDFLLDDLRFDDLRFDDFLLDDFLFPPPRTRLVAGTVKGPNKSV